MQPVYKEKYVLSKDAFGYFTIDQNKAKLDKNKRMIKFTAWVQIIVAVVFIAATIFTKERNLFVFSIMAIAMLGIGIYGLKVKYPKYDKQIWENIDSSYNGRGYGDSWFEVKFYQDHLKYNVGDNIDELHYNDFHAFYENEHYFCLHFITGDLIMFNPDCNREKIKDIILSYRKKGENEDTAAEENSADKTAENENRGIDTADKTAEETAEKIADETVDEAEAVAAADILLM